MCSNGKTKYRAKFKRPDAEKYLAVSSRGRIRGRTGVVYVPKANERGYRRTEIRGKSYSVHRLVASAFDLPRTEEQIVVDHINEDKGDNSLVNLRWASPSQNTSYSYMNGRPGRAASARSTGCGGDIEGEQWRLLGERGQSISNLGRWKNRFGNVWEPSTTDGSYCRVYLNGSLRAVHRLVVAAFSPVEGSDQLEVDHIDGDRNNNGLANLRWVTRSTNIQASYARSGARGQNNTLKKGIRVQVAGEDHWTHFASLSEAQRHLGFNFRSDGFYSNRQTTHNGVTYLFEQQAEECKGYDDETWVVLTDAILSLAAGTR